MMVDSHESMLEVILFLAMIIAGPIIYASGREKKYASEREKIPVVKIDYIEKRLLEEMR